MSGDDFELLVHGLIRSVMGGKKLPPVLGRDMNLRTDLGLDSIRLVAMLVAFEERLQVDLSRAGDVDLTRIQTVGDVIDVGRLVRQRCLEAR
jgi:acyl carrier protein